jgi:hypothetical protein
MISASSFSTISRCARSLAAIDIMSSSSRVWDMAAKERAHREIVEKLDAEIMSLRRANDELTILSCGGGGTQTETVA